jgi:2-methylcitrate dehydratase PrpD
MKQIIIIIENIIINCRIVVDGEYNENYHQRTPVSAVVVTVKLRKVDVERK